HSTFKARCGRLRTLSAMAAVFTFIGRFRSEARPGRLDSKLLQSRNRESRRSGKIWQNCDHWDDGPCRGEIAPLRSRGNGDRRIDNPWRGRSVFGNKKRFPKNNRTHWASVIDL